MTASKQNKEPKSTLVRLSEVPMIEFTVVLTLSAYSRIKSSSELLTNVLNKAEKLATSTFDGLKPIVNKFEKQINYVDQLGNSVLDKLESTVPSVTKFNPKTVYANSVNRLISVRSYAVDKLNFARSFNLNKTLNGGLKTIDNYVDEYLPGTEDEINQESNNHVNEETVSNQLWSTAGKLRRRGLKRVQNIQRLIF